VDELQAAIGGPGLGLDPDLDEMCVTMQRDLFAVGARLADPTHKIAARVEKATITDEHVTRLEGWIDGLDAELPPLRHFVLSCGGPAGAELHLARAVTAGPSGPCWPSAPVPWRPWCSPTSTACRTCCS
jgi:cob(I)alamin adenosyltransferase